MGWRSFREEFGSDGFGKDQERWKRHYSVMDRARDWAARGRDSFVVFVFGFANISSGNRGKAQEAARRYAGNSRIGRENVRIERIRV